MPEELQEELIVDIPNTGSSVDVEIEGPGVLNSGADDPDDSDDGDGEHADYSKKVKRRIDRLTKKTREAERQQEAAVSYARNVLEENQALKGRVRDLDKGYVAEYGDRIATQADSLSRDLETAIATNDTASQVSLSRKLAQLAIEEERVRNAKSEQARESQRQQYEAQQAPAQAPQPAAPVRADPKALTWAERNDWFGEDDAMTFAAFGIHKTLVEGEGFDTDTPEYYDEIDRRIRVAFPHKFNGADSSTEVRRPSQAVASASRTGSAGRKTVRLSPSEVSIARKLGVPLDQYAKYKR